MRTGGVARPSENVFAVCYGCVCAEMSTTVDTQTVACVGRGPKARSPFMRQTRTRGCCYIVGTLRASIIHGNTNYSSMVGSCSRDSADPPLPPSGPPAAFFQPQWPPQVSLPIVPYLLLWLLQDDTVPRRLRLRRMEGSPGQTQVHLLQGTCEETR